MGTATAFDSVLEKGGAELLVLPLEDLHESSKNPRKHYEPVALQQLADNLKAAGQITPVVVRPRPEGGYELAAGHRRTRAAKLAGLPSLMAIVREMDEAQFVEILNIENLQRDDLNALEEANGFTTLMKDAGYDVPKIAERIGRSVKYVYDRIKLLQLIPEAKQLLLDGTITPGHGILLARLSTEDQERAINADDGWRGGGLLETEHVDEEYFPELASDTSDDEPRKARSVREFQQWIDRNVRFVPAKVDQTDLAFDLPQTAELLETAEQSKLKVIKITREYRVPDEARDEKERTYGGAHWKRADGELEDADHWKPGERKPSKTCEYSKVGLVVAGPGRGEAFLVCVNKEKCTVHWAAEVKARAQRAKEREKMAASNGSAPAPKKPDPKVLPDEFRQKWLQEELEKRAPEMAKEVKAILPVIKLPDEICWNLVVNSAASHMHGWSKVGSQSYSGGGTRFGSELRPLVTKHLPGEWTKEQWSYYSRPKDAAAARVALAWAIWVARDSNGIDATIDKAVEARWKAQLKAEAAVKSKPLQTSAKKKRGSE
jgi:ParB/RepB/Spo0J family partition protein